MQTIELEVHTRVCNKCFNGDIEPVRHVSGFHGKTQLIKTSYKCTACDYKEPGIWESKDIKTYLDAIEAGLNQLDPHTFRYPINDVHKRVSDHLLGGGKENDAYLQQQYIYVCRLVKEQQKREKEESLLYA